MESPPHWWVLKLLTHNRDIGRERLLLSGLHSQRHVSPVSSSIQEENATRLLGAPLGEALAFLRFFQTVAGIHDGPYRS